MTPVILLLFLGITYANKLDPFLRNEIHNSSSQLLLDMQSILTFESVSDLPHPREPAANVIILDDDPLLPVLNRSKRIPHDYSHNHIDDSLPIYVTDSGDEERKVQSSGPWSPWGAPNECSRSCGGGVAYNTRVCEDPDESLCVGPTTRYFSCNTDSCGDVRLDFRAEQCSAYNNVPFEGRFYTWLPYTRAPNKCELNCMPQGERFYYRHKRKVIDGTSCGTDLICVNGNCLPVGCDGVLGSRKRQDKCRVCGGDGSSCNTVQGVFDSNELQVGYNDVLLIPAGATNILVRETQATNNYLAIRNTSGHYYLNGNWRIDFPREIPVAGTTFHYERKPHTFFAPETIRALGPITEGIYIVILYQESNPGITYEYSVPRGVVIETEHGTEYAWIYDDWGECSKTCGGGTQQRNVNCAKRSESTQNWDYVEYHLCDAAMKPETFRYCNYEIPCPVRWHVSSWDDCTAPCGSNETGTQYRNVFCEREVQGVLALVDNAECAAAHGPAPEKLRNCTSTSTECTQWFTGEWKGCSSLCGGGYNTRTVRCVSKDEMGRIVIHGDEKCIGGKPAEYEYCFQRPCEGVDWIFEGKWSECQVPSTPTCTSMSSDLKGVQSRAVYCSDAKGTVHEEKHCHIYRKPPTTQPCALDFNPAEDPSCKYTWYATQWSDCEFQSCSDMEKGKRKRTVICGTVLADMSMKVVDDDKCNDTKKYHAEEDCSVGQDIVLKNCGDEEARRKGKWFAGPWSQCSGGGRRTRVVLCMVGNRTTTDVKVCGEDDVIFTSEDCTPGDEDDLTATEAYEDDMVAFTSEASVDEESSTTTEEPCEPLTEEDYEDMEYEDMILEEMKEEERRKMSTTAVTSRSTRSVSTTESATEYYGTDDSVTVDTMEMDTSATEDGATDGMATDSSVTAAMDETSGATEESTSDQASEEPVTSGITPSSGTAATGGSTESGVTSATSATSATDSSVPTTTGEHVTTEGMITTTMESVTTTTEAVTTTTTEPTTTTTEPTTTTTEVTTTQAVTTEAITTTQAATTEAITTTLASQTTTMMMETTTASGVGTTPGSETTTMVSGATAAGGATTIISGASMGTTIMPERDTTDYDNLETPSEGDSAAPAEDEYEMGESPPLRMSDSSILNTTDLPGTGVTSFADDLDDEFSVTEIDYVTDYATELGFTTGPPPPVLPKCKPKPRKPKRPSNCHKKPFGCCPDNETIAYGPFNEGCNIPKNCSTTEFGCCDDGITPATDKFKRNCRIDCKKTLFGCCPDGKSVALGNNAEGCIKDCNQTEHGCCLDGKTAKRGPKGRNCPKIPCSEAIFGCCPDNKTPALGTNYLNCSEINLQNCKLNYFGCCIDGKTSALGDKEEGCPDVAPCARSDHGCCPDNVTFAHGPNNEGCCAASLYGCCPDNINEALGPDFKGCACTSSPYGCCPDNITPARGPNQDCGCKFTEHGCCPDGVTQATGQNHEGCGCSTFQHGCCPDGVTVAKGPAKQGCGCTYSEHGCCPDNRTPRNSSTEPCGCESSEFGCCPDGSTQALGNDFEGCEDIPIKPGDVCGLDKERGSCRNFTVKWFFDMEYGGCSRFWWGGCEGNQNQFVSQEACRSVCVEPEGRDACYLPRVSGPCEGYYPSWYYDPLRESCEQFVYSGCLGNNNRFETKQKCEHNCLLPDRVDDCDQPRTEGPCRGNYTRYFYDKTAEKCEKFTYGGCKGNSNNFLTEKECHQRCGKDVRMRDVCFQSRSEGGCNEKLPRWYYDVGEQRCVPFYYSGCQGNSNRFGTLAECEKTCPAALLSESRGCLDPIAAGDCTSYTERFGFDSYDGKCKSFVYTGCGGNSNNFVSIDDCRNKCETHSPKPVPSSENRQFSQSQCFLRPPDSPHNEHNNPPTVKWFYDYSDGVCHQFRYYGSYESQNVFDTRQDCEDKCWTSQDFCSLPVVAGPCSGRFQQFFYEKETDSCLPFEYSGCSGNGNRFDTEVQCAQRCKQEVSPPEEDVDEERRRYEAELERRRQEEEERRRIEDAHRRIEEERRRQEEQHRHTDQDHGKPMSQDDICLLAVDQGPCRAAVRSYYFDAAVSKCTEFLYGGCEGNANRFESEEMCERQCGDFRGVDVCSQTVDPGPCTSDSQKSQKWYFNANDQACSLFVYSGCGGNGNRFSSRDECESICHSRSEMMNRNDTITGAAICRLPPETGPCLEPFKRYYYNPEEKTCIPFNFGGCAGNLNRFKTFDTCVNFCEKALGYTYREQGNGNGRETAPVERQPDNTNSNYYADDNSSHLDPYNAPCDCSYLKCPYGLAPQNATSYSCSCACYDPCYNYPCPDASYRCAVDIQQGRFMPVCRSVRKPGSCPNFHHTRHHHDDMMCDQECSSDADCSGDLKCCVHGCGSSCVVALGAANEYEDVRITATDRNLNISEGGVAEMECTARGTPRPDIIWVKVDSNEKLTGESGRFRIREHASGNKVTSALQIVGPLESDAGEYSCVATTPNSPPTSDIIRLAVYEPSTTAAASVFEDPTIPTTQVVNLVPVRSTINLTRTQYSTGSEIRIPCEVEGYPTPQVAWYLNDNQINLNGNRHVRYDPPELVISEALTTDSGTYRCEATNEYAQSTSSVTLRVDGVELHVNCTDNSFFANCKLIVKANYCTNKYYARFCCKSCTLAGQLPTYGPHLNEVSQSYFRGRPSTSIRDQYRSSNNRGLISDSNDRNELFN